MVLDKRDATNYRRSEDIAKQGDLDKELNKKLRETEADNGVMLEKRAGNRLILKRITEGRDS